MENIPVSLTGKESPETLLYNKIGHQVYKQLLPDFPATAIQWVKYTPWQGPVAVPLSQIDFSNRANWKASNEPKKVKLHIKLIKEKLSMPIILCKLPGHNKYFVADAHHRLLGYEAMGKTPIAYIGTVAPEHVEEATTMHSKQLSGPSKLDGV